MSNLIPFDVSSKLPAHLQEQPNRIDDLKGGSIGFPVMSIKGKRFAIKRGDELETLVRPDDPDSPVSYIDVVLLRAQAGLSKTYYEERYTEGSEAKPTCYSTDGVAPSSQSEAKQATACALCPHNQWGSGTNDKGAATKGKACQDVKRLAIAAPGALKDAMLLRVPPASLRNLTEMGKLLKTRGVGDYAAMVTRISFDSDSASPLLKFKPVAFLEAEDYAEAQALYDDDLVQDIIGLTDSAPASEGAAPAAPAPKKAAKPAPVAEEDNEEEEEAPPPKKAAKPKPKPKPAPVAEEDDEEEEAPPPKKATKPAVVVDDDLVDDELAAMLEGFDD